jgi:hypothetical protein
LKVRTGTGRKGGWKEQVLCGVGRERKLEKELPASWTGEWVRTEFQTGGKTSHGKPQASFSAG